MTAPRRDSLLGPCAAALLAVAVAVPAQAADDQIEEVVITSQKRAAGISVQDVPIAVTAVNEALIAKTFAVDISDIGRLAPGAMLAPSATFASFPNFFVRGIGISGSTRSLDPAVGIFVDGMYLGFPVGTVVDVFDRESIEVLRGPQGTIFGRNVTGGAVNIRTRRPDGEFGIRAELLAGNYNRLDASFSVEGPLLKDKVAGKVAVMSRNRDGYWEDNNGGTVNLAINPAGMPSTPTGTKPDVDMLIVRPMLRFTPTDAIDFTLIGEMVKDKSGTANSRNIVNTLVGRRPQTIHGYTPPSDPYEINHDLIGYNDAEAKSVVGELNWDLGHGIVTGVTGYRDVDYLSSTDFDGTPFTIFHFPDNSENAEQRSLEVRYASKFSDRYEFVVGAFYFDQSYFVGERRQIITGMGLADAVLTDRAQIANIDHDNLSFFAEANFKLGSAWELTLGGRHSKEEKTALFAALGTCTLDFSSCSAVFRRDGSWSDFTPKIAVKYNFNDDTMVYLSRTEGFRSGTFDARANTVDSFLNSSPEPETVEAFELGFKTTLNDGRLRFNAAVYESDYTDIQRLALEEVPLSVNSTGRIQRLINAASATIRGVELEMSAIVAEGFKLDASVGFVDASYDKFEGFDADGVPGYNPLTDPAAARAKKFERVPELTYNIAASYDRPLAGGAELGFRVSYNWTDEYFNDALNSRIILQPAYGLIDASVNYTNAKGNLQVSLFGRNLADEEYFDFALDNALTTQTWGGVPRTFGVRLTYSYD
ncbi:MAG: TonB-dependent receptor [Steroidobacteraceae bacterium]